MYRFVRFVFCLLVFSFADVTFGEQEQALPLLVPDKPLRSFVPSGEASIVHTALGILGGDMEKLGHRKPEAVAAVQDAGFFVGTLGRSDEVDAFMKRYGWDDSRLKGQWEAFEIRVIQADKAPVLAVIGSDARGTAYGVLELSRLMGVSPWEWWADVAPRPIVRFDLPAGFSMFRKPSVAYRGIFLNDEDWGLQPWSSSTFEPAARGVIGPKTYGRIFELLLRLRANTVWPAMHETTVPFYCVPGNKEMADKYGIVVGTSHCEPLMRNNAGEWKRANFGAFNYFTNKDNILSYWAERLQAVGKSENFYTIGMRGVHDGPMLGVKGTAQYKDALNEVIGVQRSLLQQYVDQDLSKVPQAFVPYKEVLNVYNAGLAVPEDVTLVWCDDNHGYITRLSNAEERKRSGGAGLYYHLSYWGSPHDYLWLATTQPGLVYNQLRQAWDYGSRRLWIFNVGDIKPAEYLMELGLDMAWDIDSVTPETIAGHAERYWARELGQDCAQPVAAAMKEYYRLSGIRRPEFMGWSRVEEQSRMGGTEFASNHFGDQVQARLDEWQDLAGQVREIEQRIPADRKDAFFQLVKYPVLASDAMNRKFLNARKAHDCAGLNLPAADEYARLSRQALEDIRSLTRTYNEEISGGKWNRMMDMAPRKLPVFAQPQLPAPVSVSSRAQGAIVLLDGYEKPLKASVPHTVDLVQSIKNEAVMSLYAGTGESPSWSVARKPDWLAVREMPLPIMSGKRLVLEADWGKVQSDTEGVAMLQIGDATYEIAVSVTRAGERPHVEADGAVAWNACEYEPGASRSVVPVPLLGHSMNAVMMYGEEPGEAVYRFTTTSSGDAVLRLFALPTHPLNGGDLRYRVFVDGREVATVDIKTSFHSEEWERNVLRQQSVRAIPIVIDRPGDHTVSVKALDMGIVLDQLMLDFQPDRPFYHVPVPASRK